MTRPSTSNLRASRLGLLAAAVAALGSASTPVRIPNTIKYHEAATSRPGSGRSGNATLQARVLKSKDGSTLLELSTGVLDATLNTPGNIDKAQIKGFDSAGKQKFASNLNGLNAGGYQALGLPSLPRFLPVQVQANISGIDNGTDVVTVNTAVRLRPDLTAENLLLPSRAQLHNPVNITATLKELNGDVGARANAVLYVDGQAVDRIEGLWVDAQGVVSAAFTHRFERIGTHQICVRLERVAPTDYDATNNDVNGSIQIVDPATPLNFSCNVMEVDTKYHWVNAGSYVSANGDPTTYGDWNSVYDSRRWDHYTNMTFSKPQRVVFPLSAFTAVETTNGNLIASLEFNNIASDWNYDFNYGSYTHKSRGFSRYDPATFLYVWIISSGGTDNITGQVLYYNTIGYYQRYQGSVTYTSTVFGHEWFGTGYYEYFSNYNDESSVGAPRVPLGDTLNIRVAFKDAEGTLFEAVPFMNLQTTTERTISPLTYLYWSNEWFNYVESFQSSFEQSVVRGHVENDNQ